MWLVALLADQAQKAECAVGRGMKLVPCQRIDSHQVMFADRLHVGADPHCALAAQNQHGMRVLVLFER